MRCFPTLGAAIALGIASLSFSQGGFAVPKELDQRGTVIVRVPFDDRGEARPDQAELRVSARSGQEILINDFSSAEQAWNQAEPPAGFRTEEDPPVRENSLKESLQPPGYYTWNRGFPPTYYNNGYRWGYGLPGFYYGWGAGSGGGGFSVGYGPGYGWGYPTGYGYAGGFAGWYGPPLYYGRPYSSWYRPGFGYYYFPRHLGVWNRPQ